MIVADANSLAHLELRQLSRSSVEDGVVSSLPLPLRELWPWVNNLRLQCRKDWYLRVKHSTHQHFELTSKTRSRMCCSTLVT